MFAALIYAVGGTWLTHWIGRPLVRLNFNQQRYEADFRFSLVRLRENAESVAFYGGEEREFDDLSIRRFARVVGNWWDIIRRRKRLTWFTTGYAQVAIIFPFIVAAPRYFAKQIQLGGLMQIASAFGQVQDSLSFIVSSLHRDRRVPGGRRAARRLSAAGSTRSSARAARRAADRDRARRRRRRGRRARSRPAGRQPLRQDIALAASPGEPVLVTGPSGIGQEHAAARHRRAVAVRPRPASGSPTAACCSCRSGPICRSARWPTRSPIRGAAAELPRDELDEALRAVGLPHLVDQLDEDGNWAQRLSGGEQQRLGLCPRAAGAPGDRLSRRGDLGARRGGGDRRSIGCCARPMAADDRQRRPSRHVAALPRGGRRSGAARRSSRRRRRNSGDVQTMTMSR